MENPSRNLRISEPFKIDSKVALISGDENEYRLIRDLLVSYDKRVRPSVHHSKPVNITHAVALAQIIDVDEKNQVITTNCWLNQNWFDPKLKWEPTKYGNISVIRLPYTDIWRPDIVLYNNADVSSTVTSVSSNVMIQSNGNVTWLSMSIFRSSCSINVKYFPYDIQNCTLEFASWTYDMNNLNILTTTEIGDITNYVKSSEWALLEFKSCRSLEEFSCCPNEAVPFMKYSIIIKRKPLFYLFNMIMPCILITLVAFLGFYMPSESGEKVSMGITTLLSIVVFLMIVAESMPPNSDVVPLIGLYYGITIAIVSSATAMTVLTLNIHYNGSRGTEIPVGVKKVFFGFVARLLFINLDRPEPSWRGMTPIPMHDHCQYDQPEYEIDIPTQNGNLSSHLLNRLRGSGAALEPADKYEQEIIKTLKKVLDTVERNEVHLHEQDRKDALKTEWQQLAIVVDRFLLVIFVVVSITVTLCIMIPQDDIYNNSNGV